MGQEEVSQGCQEPSECLTHRLWVGRRWPESYSNSHRVGQADGKQHSAHTASKAPSKSKGAKRRKSPAPRGEGRSPALSHRPPTSTLQGLNATAGAFPSSQILPLEHMLSAKPCLQSPPPADAWAASSLALHPVPYTSALERVSLHAACWTRRIPDWSVPIDSRRSKRNMT